MPRFHQGRKPKKFNPASNWNNMMAGSFNPRLDRAPIFVVKLPNGATFTKCPPVAAEGCTQDSVLFVREHDIESTQ